MSLAQGRNFRWLLTLAAISSVFQLSCSQPGWAEERRIDAQSRWATFDSGTDAYFAVSVQADPTGSYPQPQGSFEVVAVMDTSATQTGPVRLESLEVLEELAASLPSNAKISLLACDVDTVDLSNGLVAPNSDQWRMANARLQQRIPLGATNLGKALETAAEQFSDQPSQRTIVYIGDGVNRTQFLDSAKHRGLVDKLVDNRITFSALAIGPVVDVATLAAFANHTGGLLYSRSEIQETTQAIGHNLGQSCLMPVVWIEEAKLPARCKHIFRNEFPPLRVDRDTIIVGRCSDDPQAGEVVLRGVSAGQAVVVRGKAVPEASHPDMGFLTVVTESASRDGGLTLPALGSPGLRSMSYMLADSATSMVKSGQFALKSGEVESAIRIAEEALKSDPNNAEAISLLNAAKKAAAEVPTGKFTQTSAPIGDSNASNVFSETLNAGELLADEQAQRRVIAQAFEADVRGKLRDAQELMRRDPTAVKNSLKLLLEELDSAAIDPNLQAQLRGQVASAIRLAALEEANYLDDLQRAETLRAQADQAQRLLAETAVAKSH